MESFNRISTDIVQETIGIFDRKLLAAAQGHGHGRRLPNGRLSSKDLARCGWGTHWAIWNGKGLVKTEKCFRLSIDGDWRCFLLSEDGPKALQCSTASVPSHDCPSAFMILQIG
jgi:hypothetical protein